MRIRNNINTIDNKMFDSIDSMSRSEQDHYRNSMPLLYSKLYDDIELNEDEKDQYIKDNRRLLELLRSIEK